MTAVPNSVMTNPSTASGAINATDDSTAEASARKEMAKPIQEKKGLSLTSNFEQARLKNWKPLMHAVCNIGVSSIVPYKVAQPDASKICNYGSRLP